MRLRWGRLRIRRAPAGPFEIRRIATSSARIEVGLLGTGPLVALLPGLGGAGTEQYGDLAIVLADAGFRSLAINPRGIGRSRGPLEDITLHDLAQDVADVIREFGGSAHVVGRAYGNRVARMLATDHPECVRSTTLVAAGGLIPPSEEPPRRGLARRAGASWRVARKAQQRATRCTPVESWWDGGTAPTLVIQGLEDRTAVPENGRRLARDFPERVRLIEIEKGGHRLFRDCPEVVIPQVVGFIAEMEGALGAND